MDDGSVLLSQDALRSSPFRWSRVGSQEEGDLRGRRRRPTSSPGRPRPFRDEDDDEDDDGGEESCDDDSRGTDPEERLRDLFRFIDGQSGGGTLRQWQRGGNPWGTSTSDRWHQQVSMGVIRL